VRSSPDQPSTPSTVELSVAVDVDVTVAVVDASSSSCGMQCDHSKLS